MSFTSGELVISFILHCRTDLQPTTTYIRNNSHFAELCFRVSQSPFRLLPSPTEQCYNSKYQGMLLQELNQTKWSFKII